MNWNRFVFIILGILHLSIALLAQNLSNYPDVTILQSNERGLIFEWRPAQFTAKTLTIEQKPFHQIFIAAGKNIQKPGEPDIPWRFITFALPNDAPASVTILETQTHTLENVDIAPVPWPTRDASGISTFQFFKNDSIYAGASPFPRQILRITQPAYFRELPIQTIKLSPVQYFPDDHRLIIYDRIKLQIRFKQKAKQSLAQKPAKFLEEIAKQTILNFDRARNWSRPSKRSLKKVNLLPDPPFYKIEVEEDGLYKITPSVLETAGINLNNFTIDQIQIFNNGGHELHYNTSSIFFNPPNTQEIPILVIDLNNDQKFNGSDYILFYGKHVNGWFFEPTINNFKYQQHTFARKNIYWLSINGSNGRRMALQPLPAAGSGDVSAEYFYDRYHFEEDLYNLLSSGPDWYGYRFFGTSGGYTKDFKLSTDPDAKDATAQFKIQFKGGSGIHWTDYKTYQYDFSILLNNNLLYNRISFTNATLITFKKDITDLSILKNGSNNLNITYSGNRDACNVYLNWFEVIYPRALKAHNDQLLIYADQNTQAVNYTITNLSSLNDYYIFDVTDPANPILLASNLETSNGTLTFTLPPSSTKRQILISSLSSSNIKLVTSLQSFTPHDDLLNPGNQADYIVVTHKTFLPYAQKFADLHKDKLHTKVVCMSDVYFYFNSGVPDPTALRNFLRYTQSNWSSPAPSYVLFFGDAHYDYRNINLPDTIRVPTWEIYDAREIDSRCTDDYFVDLDYHGSLSFNSFTPDLAAGRIPVESTLDCERILEKIHDYHFNAIQDGWQTNITLVADDQYRKNVSTEYQHQEQTEDIARLPELRKFILNKVYLSAYPSVPGGFLRIKPKANEDLINFLNQGTLIVNYIGHGNPTKWAHEDVFNMDRDYSRIINEGRLCFLVAATCDFGKFDDPNEPSFTEALIWKEKSGIIGAMASTRLAYSTQNATLAYSFYKFLFPLNQNSSELGIAKLKAVGTSSSINDQKYILFADPAMHLADPKEPIEITEITPDTLKALSKVTVKARILNSSSFEGEAVLLVHDAAYENVKTDKGFSPITMVGPRIFKGQVDVVNGQLTGRFIIPKSIRYVDRPTGRITIYAYSLDLNLNAMGYNDRLLINGSKGNVNDQQGPEIDIFFKDQENFSSGDLIADNSILIVNLQDENGINITGETGHNISLQVDDEAPKDISGFFAYDKNSFQQGKIEYPLTQLKEGQHTIKIQAFDNLNNLSTAEVLVKVASTKEILLTDVVNYPNPFRDNTRFTFQTNVSGADVKIKIYTVTGRLIQELHGTSVMGYNDEIQWNGRDRDGDEIANGVYLYKIILREGQKKKTVIDKLVIMR